MSEEKLEAIGLFLSCIPMIIFIIYLIMGGTPEDLVKYMLGL